MEVVLIVIAIILAILFAIKIDHNSKKADETIKVKIKLLPGGKMPRKMTNGAAAYDCYARSSRILDDWGNITNSINFTQIKYDLGFALELPDGYCAKIIPRSSVVKTRLRLANNIGLIDADYRGEISAVFDYINSENPDKSIYLKGDRVCQLLIEKVEKTSLVKVKELSKTKRGHGGYGSTGN